MRAAIYARYSSEHQREASIDDQIRVCRDRISQEGWETTKVFQDRALSGASRLRPDYQALLTAASQGHFDVVVAEALDRLSRDQEDVAALYKHLRFHNVKLFTLSEGEINELHVGLKGTMNALFLRDLATKTHRGMSGRVQAGKSGGGLSYGYDVVRQLDEHGERVRGERAINQTQATVLQRIFEMFTTGSSPIAIARQLNVEGIAGPEGRAWRDTTIRGHAKRGTGILRNELYVGNLVWNRMRFVRDPKTSKRVSRMNPESALVRQEVPHLRIINDSMWTLAQERLRSIRVDSGADDPSRNKFWERRRAASMLTDKIYCGSCGGRMANTGKDYLACSAARRQATCSNAGSIRRGVLEDLVLNALQRQLMQPDLVAEFAREFMREWNRALAEATGDREVLSRELSSVERKLTGLIDAIASGFRSATMQSQVDSLEARKIELTRKLDAPAPAAPRLHPNLAEVYRQKIARLQDTLRGDAKSQEAVDAVRSLIERLVLTPTTASKGFEIELVGEITAMIRLGMNDKQPTAVHSTAAGSDLFSRSVKVVAGVGFEPTTFRL